MSGATSGGAIVIAASVDFDGQRLSEQHVALALAARHQVLYLDPPRPAYTRDGGLARGRAGVPLSWSVSWPAPRLQRLSVTVPPGMRHPALAPWADRFRTLVARRVLRRRGIRASAVLSAAGRPSVFTGYDGARLVFWAKDDYVAGAGLIGMNSDRIAAGQRAVAGLVDSVVAVTPGLLATWSERVPDTVLIPAGSDPAFAADAAAATPRTEGLPRPIAGFVGQVSDRVDLALLEAVADSGASLLLVGRRQAILGEPERFDDLTSRDNVRWVGARRYEELPAYLAAIDVGLIPYANTSFNTASFPLKLLEYLSVGAAVVSTDLPAVRWLDAPGVRRTWDATAFASMVSEQLQEARRGGPELERARRARRAVAGQHTWSTRADAMALALGLG